jgi:hypothetical protein
LIPLIFSNIEVPAQEDFDGGIQWTSSVEAKLQDEKVSGEKKLTSGKLEHLRKEKVRKIPSPPKMYRVFTGHPVCEFILLRWKANYICLGFTLMQTDRSHLCSAGVLGYTYRKIRVQFWLFIDTWCMCIRSPELLKFQEE